MGLLTLLNVVAFLVVYVEAYSLTECPWMYRSITENHSYCKTPNPKCSILASSVSPDDIKYIVGQHNAIRSEMATGNEEGFPPAADMLQMIWDEELAVIAQNHANQCVENHDCSDCRRVQRFAVGQNIAIEPDFEISKYPLPNWKRAIKNWYSGKKVFSKELIDSYYNPVTGPDYRHYSQLIWAKSWRIGCGYVLYQDGNVYKRIYVCNYGPLGNVHTEPVFKRGTPCSACPANSCCDNTCGLALEFRGLCKITNDIIPVEPEIGGIALTYKPITNGIAPTYKPITNGIAQTFNPITNGIAPTCRRKTNRITPTCQPQYAYIFCCDFRYQRDCQTKIAGQNNWKLSKTSTGTILRIVLKGGQTSTLHFTKSIKPSATSFCFVTKFRKGAVAAGEEETGVATETFIMPDRDLEIIHDLETVDLKARDDFQLQKFTVLWNERTEVKITFSVPDGKPAQFFEIKSLYSKEGPC